MFDIGFPELLLIILVSLIVIGPERLPELIKSFSRIYRYIKEYINKTKTEVEKNIGMDSIRQDLHNERKMKDFKNQETLQDSKKIDD